MFLYVSYIFPFFEGGQEPTFSHEILACVSEGVGRGWGGQEIVSKTVYTLQYAYLVYKLLKHIKHDL